MKRFFRILAIAVLILLGIPLAILLFFWVKNQIYVGGTDSAAVVYLKEHQQDISEATAGANLFDDEFYHNQVFLLGENHGVADVQFVDQLLLKHLNQKVGLKYYIAEMDSTRANWLNEFLANPEKDTALLKRVVTDVGRRIPQQASQGLFDKWLAIRDYNQQLADSLKITVIGIDKHLEDTSRAIGRDSAMFLNFRQAVVSQNLANAQFYGLLGYTHVLQEAVYSERFTPFAAKVKNSDLGLAPAIQSIVCYNLDSEVRLPATGQMPTPPDEKTGLLNVDGPIVMVKGIKDLEEVTEETSITLFNLGAANSPYQSGQRLAGVKVNLMGRDVLPANPSQPTTDFFQYVVLIRGSEALTKLE